MSNKLRKIEILKKIQSKELTPQEGVTLLKSLKSKKAPTYRECDIAIVGMSGIFPGANTIDEYWQNLKKGTDSISKVPLDRWNMDAFYSPTTPENTPSDKSYCQHGGFIENPFSFDPSFFAISPVDAEKLDPQERLFLQNSWHTLEDAGYTLDRIKAEEEKGSIGVYLGETTNNYNLHGPEQWERENKVLPTTLPWSMANRVSYFFNFSGPSITIDTACSSSLVAIHQAMRALREGEITTALVGGVNLYLHPSKYVWLSQMNMLSPSGRCHSFGSKADGFCPGEGIISILLKPIHKAEEDGDHIYGVLKGSAVNHDGKTTGYTVPNPRAQANLIRSAMKDADVHPNDISCIEAHGTGTKLGDPIEISGLQQALSNRTIATPCAVSSAKANIGHLESAAGIAGLIKVLLQMKYKEFVPSIHCVELNENLHLSDSLLHIQRENEHWDCSAYEKEVRTAGVSSFGAGGVNAHLIVQEYSNPSCTYKTEQEQLILFSAHTKASLLVQLNNFLALENISNISLEKISHLSRVFKTHFSLRISFIANSLKDLQEQIQRAINTSPATISKVAPSLQAGIKTYTSIYNAKEMWDSGKCSAIKLPTDPAIKPENVLPLYPFGTDQYKVSLIPSSIDRNIIHPLVGKNSSTFDEISFSTTFNGSEFYLTDHIVKGKKTLPGAAYLEMVLQAYKSITGKRVTVFRNVSWPVAYHYCEHDNTIKLTLTQNGDTIQFKATSSYEGQLYVHAQGECNTSTTKASQFMVKQAGEIIKTKKETYELFEKCKLVYKKAFQTIQVIQAYSEGTIAELKLPAISANPVEKFILHPSLLDGAFQTTIAHGSTGETLLPFELKELQLHSSLNQNASVIAKAQNITSTSKTFDLDIFQDAPLITIKGFTLRSIKDNSNTNHASSQITYIRPTWKDSPTPKSTIPSSFILLHCQNSPYPATTQSCIIESRSLSTQVLQKIENDATISYVSIAIEIDTKKPLAVEFNYLKDIISEITSRLSIKVELLFFSARKSKEFHAISGMLRTISVEHTQFYCKHITFGNLSQSDIITALLSEKGEFIKYSEIEITLTERKEKSFEEIEDWDKNLRSYNFAHKRFIVTGGMGGIGFKIVQRLLKHENTEVVVLGRSSIQREVMSKMLLKLEPEERKRFYYIESNLDQTFKYEECSQKAQQVLIRERDKHAPHFDYLPKNISNKEIDGVFHTAGITNDSLLTQKDTTFVPHVLSPKVDGTKNLLQAIENGHIKGNPSFVILFSSIASILGNSGQSDYATANAYLNAVADMNPDSKDKSTNASHMQNPSPAIKSIHWPLWADGGMQVSKEKQELFEHNWGMKLLPDELGMTALKEILASPEKEILPFYGSSHKVLMQLHKKEHLHLAHNSEDDAKALEMRLIDKLYEIFSELTGYESEHIESYTTLDELGFDSIKITELANRVNKELSLDVSAAIFFEFLTIDEISNHLLETYYEELCNSIGTSNPVANNSEVTQETAIQTHTQSTPQKTENIAIVGISGRFPQSPDVHSFWENLLYRKDCISEVPNDRWNWQDFDDEGLPKWGGFIEGIKEFDPLFFGISPAEAKLMDPQQRIFLESVWHAIEDSGHKPSSLSGTKTGLYLGVSVNDYAELMEKSNTPIKAQSSIGSVHSMIVNRISYLLNLRGPSEPIDTACSSSLVALHRALQDLHSGNAEMAIVGGVNEILSPKLGLSFHKAGMLSPTGRCKTFSDEANGYVRSEGVGTLILKPLSKAKEDGDHVYALVKGSHVNHGGKAKSLTAPNPKAQAELLLEAYEKAEVPFASVSYLETHGTGTQLGDPIEIHGLSSVAKKESTPEHKCVLGSVKANVGHLESAAGITGVIKVLLAMKNQIIPGTPHLHTINPHIQLSGTPYSIATETTPWETNSLPRRAGVSSFGFGGVNAHTILEEYTTIQQKKSAGEEQLFIFSAKSKKSLLTYLKKFVIFIDSPSYEQPVNNDDSNEKALLCSIIAQKLSLPLEAIDLSLPPIELGIDIVTAKVITNSFNEQSSNKLTFGDFIHASSLNEVLSGINSSEGSINTLSIEDIAFTLQTGREEYRYRVATIADSLSSLKESIVNLTDESITDCKENTDKTAVIEYSNLQLLKEKWCSGTPIEFGILHDSTVRRVSLPGYVFEKENYWFEDESVVKNNDVDILTADVQNYCDNHKIFNENIVPGAVLFNICINKTNDREHPLPLHVKEVNWINKVSTEEIPLLETSQDTSDANTIWLQSKAKQYCSAQISQTPSEPFNISTDKDSMYTLQKSEVYNKLEAQKYEYGKLLQPIQEIKYSNNFAMVELVATDLDINNFVFPPSILDGAFQAVRFIVEDTETVLIPRKISGITIWKPIPKECTAVIIADLTNESRLTFDILFRDNNNITIAQIKGYEVAPLLKQKSEICYFHETLRPINTVPYCDSESFTRLLSHAPDIKEIELNDEASSITINFSNSQHHEKVQKLCLTNTVNTILCDVDSLFSKDAKELITLFTDLQQLYKTLADTVNTVVCITSSKTIATKSLTSFIEVCNSEFSRIRSLFLQVDSDIEYSKNLLATDFSKVEQTRLSLSKGKYATTGLTPIAISNSNVTLSEGTYLITGGTGSIGLQVLNFLQSKLENSTIILWGRRETEEVKSSIPYSQNRNNIIYQSVDISRSASVQGAISKVKVFESIKGVFHCAGILLDGMFLSQNKKDMETVLSAKIKGVENLNNYFNRESLEYFVLFSSTSSYLGKSGQSMYAYANGYLNNFAANRNKRVREEKAFGKTISICWPYWKQGGMQLTKKQEETLFSLYGMRPLPSHTAMTILDTLLSTNEVSPVCIYGDESKIQKAVQNVYYKRVPESIKSDNSYQTISKETIEKIVRDAISSLTAIDPNEFDSTEIITSYGLDSITLTELSQNLQDSLQTDITPVTLFEVNTIEKLTEYIYETTSLKISTPFEAPEPLTETEEMPITKESDIAIVGMDCIFPGAKNHREFWQNLLDKKCSISEIPTERWNLESSKNHLEELHINYGGFIDSVRQFDREYFSLSKIEAELMDPQQRLLLHSVRNTLSDAGVTPEDIKESDTGVFVGISSNDYRELLIEETDIIQPQTATGNANSIVANRISYNLDLHGPSEAVDTACSSSLVALHRAVQSIQNGDCSSAFVAGVNALLSPRLFIAFDKAGMLSAKGRCSSFDKEADGYVRGEGVGTIYIKKLEDAINDGNHIYATIKGGAVNHGGKSNSLTAPKAEAQAKLIQKALTTAEVDAESISYIEAHGTGTKLGDPIEIEGLKKVFNKNSQECAIGTVKTNIGHLESAAGIAGIIKVANALQQKQLPGLATFTSLNPYISLENSPLYLLKDTKTWSIQSGPRRAGVSSFGFGGVNAHYILEEYLKTDHKTDQVFPLLLLSVRTAEQLLSYAKILYTYIQEVQDISIEDILYTLQAGREQHHYRVALICKSIDELKTNLQQIISGKASGIPLPKTLQRKEYAVQSSDTIDAVCKKWMEGYTLNWKSYYNPKQQRVSLPPLPFISEEYWFPVKGVDNTSHLTSGNTKQKLYELVSHILNDSTIHNTNKSLEELGIDSILRIKLGHEIEKSFSVSIEISQLAQINYLDELLEFLPHTDAAAPLKIPTNEFEEMYEKCFNDTENIHISLWGYSSQQMIELLDIGQGEPILFYNGLGFTFAAIHKLLKNLSVSNRVIIFNYPGIGNSASISSDYSVKMITDITIKLLAHLDINKVHLMGWSLGGFMAQAFAEKYAGKVKSLTIINSAHYLRGDYSLASVNTMMTLVQEVFQNELQRVSKKEQEEILTQIKGTSNTADSFKLFKFALQFNRIKRFFKINKPTLIIGGEKDNIILPKDTQQIFKKYQEKNLHVSLKTYPEESHYIPMFADEKTVNDIFTFLHTVDGRSNNKVEQFLIELTTLNDYAKHMLYSRLVNYVDSTTNPLLLDTFIEFLQIKPESIKLFNGLLNILTSSNYINIQGRNIQFKEAPKAISPKLHYTRPHFELLQHAISNIPEVLSRKKAGTEVLFPDGLSTYVENIYRGNPFSDYLNTKLADKILDLVRKSDKKIKILEIGAGTASTTTQVLKKLNNKYNYEYHFTDISPYFLSEARKKLSRYKNIEFYTLNIEENEDSNNHFDIIIASNVLHATKDIKTTLLNINALLKTNGHLILNELTKFEEFTTLTFGLLDGWWLSRDTVKRIKDSPLLSLSQWKEEMQQCGITNFSLLTDKKIGNITPPASVFIAQKTK